MTSRLTTVSHRLIVANVITEVLNDGEITKPLRSYPVRNKE